MGGAELGGSVAGRPQLGGLPDREREGALEERGVDALSLAGALARVQGAQDADRAEQPGGEIARPARRT